MFCAKCGTEVASDVRFCPSCGSAVGGSPAAEHAPAAEPAPAPAAEPAGPQIPAAPFGEVFRKLRDLPAYLSLDGRARRGEFWCTVLVPVLPLTVTAGVLAFVIALCAKGGLFALWLYGLVQILSMAASVALYPVFVRRLHDLGISGWLAVGLIAGQIVPWIGSLAMSVCTIVFGCIPGRATENAYGASPLVPDAAPVANPRRECTWIFWAVVLAQIAFAASWASGYFMRASFARSLFG